MNDFFKKSSNVATVFICAYLLIRAFQWMYDLGYNNGSPIEVHNEIKICNQDTTIIKTDTIRTYNL